MMQTANWDAVWCPELGDYCLGKKCSQMKDDADGSKYCEMNDVKWERRK